jgi:hypothetical protein
VLALLHGEPARALQQNPLLVLSLPLFLGWATLVSWRKLRHGSPVALPRYSATVALVVLVLFFILRNLPWWPCTLLAPHG